MLSSYILRMAEAGEQIAFVEQGVYRSRVYSYRRVVERSLAFGRWLRERGLGVNDKSESARVLIWAAPSARWAMAFYGSVLAGNVVVPVDAGFSPEFVARVARHTHASLLICDPSNAAVPESLGIAKFLTSEHENLPRAPDQPAWTTGAVREALAEIVYTSGTTAEPRGVMITHGNLLANLEPVEREIARYRHFAVPFHPLRFLHLIPLSHLFGQIMGLFVPQLLRGMVIFPESQATAELARVIRERRVSAMVSVPQQLEAMGQWALAQLGDAQAGKAEGRDRVDAIASATDWSIARRWWKFRRVHRALGWKMWAFVVGGAALPPEVERLWNALGYAVVQGYGLTETAPAITITHPFKIHRGSVGRLLPGSEVRIAEDGEILARGPNVSPGYYQNPEATRAAFTEGWLRTGDLGRLDAEGNLIYLGRKKEVIVTVEGLNVFPEDVERALLAEPEVKEAAVVGRELIAEGIRRTLVHAVLVPQAGLAAGELDAAIARANQRLEPHQRIRGYSLWPEPTLPRTLSTRKLQRAAIAAWANQAEPKAPATSAAAAAADDWRAFLVQLGIAPNRLAPEARLAEDLGLSSLDRVELLTWLETRGYFVDEDLFARARTVGELEESIGREKALGQAVAAVGARPEEIGDRRAKQGEASGEATLEVREAGAAGSATPSRAAEAYTLRTPALHYPQWPQAWPARAARTMWQYLIAYPLITYYVKLEVEGAEKFQKLATPALFVANHQSLLDVAVILRALPRRLARRLAPAMGVGAFDGEAWRRLWAELETGASQVRASDEIRSRFFLFLARLLYNGYLLPDDPAGAREALRHAGRLAERGYSTLLFPEGLRTPDGRLGRFRAGVGVMAERLELPVVPLLLEGLVEIWPRALASPTRGRARLRLGEPLVIKPGESAAQFAARLEEFYRGWMARAG